MENKKYTGEDLNKSWEIGYNVGEIDGSVRAMRKCIEFLEQEIERVKNPKKHLIESNIEKF